MIKDRLNKIWEREGVAFATHFATWHEKDDEIVAKLGAVAKSPPDYGAQKRLQLARKKYAAHKRGAS